MATLSIVIKQSDVYTEVERTTSYVGAKMKNDDGAYDRIFAVTEDQTMLNSFWSEASSGAAEALKQFISSYSMTSGTDKAFNVSLTLSSSHDSNLDESIKASLKNYFVLMITSKWFKFCNREDCESYATDAQGAIDDVMRKIYYKKKPARTQV